MSTSKNSARSNRRPSGGGSAKPKPSAAQQSARARLAAEQARTAARRRRMLLVAIPVALVLVAVLVLVVVRLVRPSQPTAGPAVPGDNSVISSVTSVPSDVLDQIGAGTAKTAPKSINAPALTENGKPKVLYVGAEYCPYCAAERWPMVVALSRFGTFSGLGQTTSSAQDVYPSTPTLSFHGSSFTSDTIAFTGVETQSNQIENGQYAPLDQLSAEDAQTEQTYNQPPYTDTAGSIPFVDIGGKYVINGASYDPGLLAGKTHAEIASALHDPNSDIAKAVDGTANLITAAICATTKNAPSNVCNSAGVQAAAKQLS